MSVSFPAIAETSGHLTEGLRSRFEVCRSLENGENAFPLTRIDPLFDDQPVSFGRVFASRFTDAPTEWMLQAIRRLSESARELDLKVRPIHVPMPMAILQDDDAPARAFKAAEEAGFCAQEFMLEIADASLANGDAAAFDTLDAFRRKGFRIALDARRSAATPFSERIRGAIERLRVSSEDLMLDEMLQLRADIVRCLGGDVIVDRANWRQAEDLTRLGASHALKLLSDA